MAFFVGYFIFKMLPTILAEHGMMPSGDRRQMESVATLLASAKPGDQLTAERVEQLQGMLSPSRSRRWGPRAPPAFWRRLRERGGGAGDGGGGTAMARVEV